MGSLEVNVQLTELNCQRTALVPSGQRDALSRRPAFRWEREPFPRGSSIAWRGHPARPPPRSPLRGQPRASSRPSRGTVPLGLNHPGPCRGQGLPMQFPGGSHPGAIWGRSNPLGCLSSDLLPGLSEKPRAPPHHGAADLGAQRPAVPWLCARLAEGGRHAAFHSALPDATGLASFVGLSCQRRG